MTGGTSSGTSSLGFSGTLLSSDVLMGLVDSVGVFFFDVSQFITGVGHGMDERIKLRMDRCRVPILGVLDNEDHVERRAATTTTFVVPVTTPITSTTHLHTTTSTRPSAPSTLAVTE